MNYIGIDGCRGGWLLIGLDDDENWESGIIPDIKLLVDRFHSDCLILIDIPIGLRENGKLERQCDKEARKVLGKRGSSVFPSPCRPAVHTIDYENASLINYELTGRKLSKQSWSISHKIRQVDMLLRKSEKARKLIREVHPEVCFWGLNNRVSMKHPKKKIEGFNERLKVIRKIHPKCDEIVKYTLKKHKGQGLSRDDILDALSAVVTAKYGYNKLKTLPEVPEHDIFGLPMEMVYYRNMRKIDNSRKN